MEQPVVPEVPDVTEEEQARPEVGTKKLEIYLEALHVQWFLHFKTTHSAMKMRS